MPMEFNPAPGWPSPPSGWVPPAGWQPDPSWPSAPPGWQFWTSGQTTARDGGDAGATDPNPADSQAHPNAQQANQDQARAWVAEITRLADRRRSGLSSRVTLLAPPVKGGLMGRVLAIGVSAALGGGVNLAALDAAGHDQDAHSAIRLPDTCILCGLIPGAITDHAEITIDASTLGFFLGGELLSQQKITVPFRLCGECANPKIRALAGMTIERYLKVQDTWIVSLRFLNDRVAESVRALNRPNLITTLTCLRCGFFDDDQTWLAREDVCPRCHTVYANGRAWLCPKCGKNLPLSLLSLPRVPKTRRQALWGGLSCPRCGADVPKP